MPANDDLTPSERLASVDDMLLYRLGQLTAVAGAMVVRLCEGGYGVTRREWAVVAQLHGHPQGLLPSALAEHMQRDRTRTSRALKALQTKGLVQRTTLPHDRRSARVRLTPAGEVLYGALMPQVQAINQRILSVLSEDEMARFDDGIDRLRRSAEALRQTLDADLPRTQRRLGRRGVDEAGG